MLIQLMIAGVTPHRGSAYEMRYVPPALPKITWTAGVLIVRSAQTVENAKGAPKAWWTNA